MHPAITSSPARYSPLAIGMHWLLALLIALALGTGLIIANLPFSPLKLRVMSWHKWLGVSILLFSALRLWWRLVHRPPALPAAVKAAMPGWQCAAHAGTHYLLYGLFFAVPLLGWMYSSAYGVPVVWFGVLPLPDLVPVDKELARSVLRPLHQCAAYTLAGLIAVHIAAALTHHCLRHDGLLSRMWPITTPPDAK